MNILYTGFKGKNNTSYQLAEQFHGSKLFLTNSFSGIKKDINNIQETYDMVFMFGVDKTLTNSVRLELCAQKNGNCLSTSATCAAIATELENGKISYTICESPTLCLCNEAYYDMLEKVCSNAVFIHIPTIKGMSDELMKKLVRVFGEGGFYEHVWPEQSNTPPQAVRHQT